jgi:hypothetical protein
MIKLTKIISKIKNIIKEVEGQKPITKADLANDGYVFYEEAQDWIKWDKYKISYQLESDGSKACDLFGRGIKHSKYIGETVADKQKDGSFKPNYDQISDIKIQNWEF